METDILYFAILDSIAPALLFPAIWFFATWLIGHLSGWTSLERRYSDRANEVPISRATWESGRMGFGVWMRNILTLEACPSGLRLKVPRIFMPLSGPIFIPWREIKMERKNFFLSDFVELSFGAGYGTLTIRASLADRFWKGLPEVWPESGVPSMATDFRETGREIFFRWIWVSAGYSLVIFILLKFLGKLDAVPLSFIAFGPAGIYGLRLIFDHGKDSLRK